MSIYENDRLVFVEQSVKSILNQTYITFDFYIIFDGPVQNDVKDYLTNINDQRVKIINREINRGLAYSLNELLKRVLNKKYMLIARMDADDVSREDRLEKQVDFLQANPEIDCIGSWAIEINSEGSEYFKKEMPVNHDQCLNMFHKRDCMIHPTVMFRRSYFEKAGLYPEDTYFGEDTMMWANGFANGCKFSNIPDYLLKFRLDENFFSRRRGWKHAKSIWRLRRKVNQMLGFGYKENIYAFLYASAKMMPQTILNVIYKTLR